MDHQVQLIVHLPPIHPIQVIRVTVSSRLTVDQAKVIHLHHWKPFAYISPDRGAESWKPASPSRWGTSRGLFVYCWPGIMIILHHDFCQSFSFQTVLDVEFQKLSDVVELQRFFAASPHKASEEPINIELSLAFLPKKSKKNLSYRQFMT
eukprot:TRINITY_DN6731_c0_g1_i1.p1 TRINITY_DN6731_c0_g1~~TRINITY_DN6731_c0_g1_i1.p1  ORF type:complete len:150 (+),score=2.23 TRINITY_DN6731_c0_g1_i1:55-504(+)